MYKKGMCLILFAVNAQPGYPLIIAANRDEFYNRKTDRLAFWADCPGVLAGRDRQGGGTWLGITRSGRIGAVTNFRDPAAVDANAPSRGDLVKNYLTGDLSAEAFLEKNKKSMARYNGFNLIVGKWHRLLYYSNREGVMRPLAAGIHGVSNHLLNTPWPKVEKGKKALASLLSGRRNIVSHEDILGLLADREIPPEDQLPDTGVGLEWERRLAPVFIKTDIYGTRSSTVLTVDREKTVTVTERTFEPSVAETMPHVTEQVSFTIQQS